MTTENLYRHRIPSVDPEVEQAADDVLRDPDAYFVRQRALYQREAEAYVRQELARATLERRSQSLRRRLARATKRLCPLA